MDRFFDNYVMAEMQKPVFEALRAEGARKEVAMAEARQALETAYSWLENRLDDRTWAAGEAFTMAGCSAAPSLFYADWVHQIGSGCRKLRKYRFRLLARPSFARAVEEPSLSQFFHLVRPTEIRKDRRCLGKADQPIRTPPGNATAREMLSI